MPSPEQRALDLEEAVQQAIAILRHHAEASWASELEAVMPLIQRREAIGLKRLLAMFGGMGTINDILIMRFNGHDISEVEEEAVNRVLHSCLDRVYELARDLLREVR